jgi:hypothetical protein
MKKIQARAFLDSYARQNSVLNQEEEEGIQSSSLVRWTFFNRGKISDPLYIF